MLRILRDRRLWIGLTIIALAFAVRLTGLSDVLSIEALRHHRGILASVVADHLVLAAAAFIMIYTAAVALSLPGAATLTLASGFLFGAFSGALLSVTGATLGATLVFLLAKRLFGSHAMERAGKQGARIADGLRANAWAYLLVLRLVPLFPFFLVNLVAALVAVPFRTYVITTFFGIVPGSMVFALSGSGLGSVLDQTGAMTVSSVLTPEIVAALCGLAGLALIAIPIRRSLERGALARRLCSESVIDHDGASATPIARMTVLPSCHNQIVT